MLTFERIVKENLYIIEEMYRSNPNYCEYENNGELPNVAQLEEEFIQSENSYFLKADDTYVGIIDYLENNKKDNCPWLGLLMIHGDYQGYGYGTTAYIQFEEIVRELEKSVLRLGVIKENTKAKKFWELNGYEFFEEKMSNKGIVVDCYEKKL